MVTAVEVGTAVHDFVHVSGTAGGPKPSGAVTIDWFSGTLGNECATLLSTSSAFTLDANGEVDASGFSFTPTSAGFRGFRAHYGGDQEYEPSDGACEPLRVVDANIQIAPLSATNPVAKNHLLTAHVNVNAGRRCRQRAGWDDDRLHVGVRARDLRGRELVPDDRRHGILFGLDRLVDSGVVGGAGGDDGGCRRSKSAAGDR